MVVAMVTEAKKQSEIMWEKALEHLDRVMPHYDSETQRQLHETRAFVRQMADYIDAEHERRAAFEKDMLERLGELEDWRNGKGPKLEPIAAGTGDPT
jgi:hypothetical protein